MKQEMHKRRQIKGNYTTLSLQWKKHSEEKPVTTRGKKRFKRLVFLLAAVAVLGSFFSLINGEGSLHQITSKMIFFRIKDVFVWGNNAFSDEELLKLGGLSGAGLKGNLWDFPRKDVSARLASCPRFKKVFTVLLPPQWVLILLLERKAVALVNAGGVFGVDREGIVFPLAKKERGIALPLITGLNNTGSVNRGLMQKFKEIHEAAGPWFSEISEINVADPANIVIYTNNAVCVWLGAGSFERKFICLKVVWKKLQAEQAKPPKKIDLRWDGQVVVKQS